MAKKILVLDDNKQLQEIESGATSYKELTDCPLNVSTLYTTVSSDGTLTPSEGHAWTEEELLAWCAKADTGKYDIFTEEHGIEILMVDNTNENQGRRYRRITVDYDAIYDEDSGWTTISDMSAKRLIFNLSNDIPQYTVVGNDIKMECYYYSSVGPGTITVMKGTHTVAVMNLEVNSTVSISLTNEIEDGSNVFTYTVTNNGTNTLLSETAGSFSIYGIDVTYTPSFNVLQKRSGDVDFSFAYTGYTDRTIGYKYIHFDITNAKGEVKTYAPSTRYEDSASGTVTLPAEYFSHGINKISTYMYMYEGNTTEILAQTDELNYEFPYVEDENDPILMVTYDFNGIQAWDTVNIPYYIWANKNATSIKLELEYTQENEDGEMVTKYVTQEYDNSVSSYINSYLMADTQHNWQISNVPNGTLNFRIYINGEETARYEKLNIEVPEGDWNFNSITASRLFNFAPTDIADTKPFTQWEGGNGYVMDLSNFNWSTDGLLVDDDSNKSLKFAPAARAKIENLRIMEYAENSGITIEIDFMVDSAADNSKPIIQYYWSESTTHHEGITVYPTKAVFNYNDNTSVDVDDVTVYYQKGERVNLAFTIEPSNSTTSNTYVKAYINGILSYLNHYPSNVSFSTKCDTIEFNTAGNEFYLYGFRGYNAAISSRQCLQNYVSNFGSTTKKVEILTKNNIYKTTVLDDGKGTPLTGEYVVDFEKTKKQIATLVIIMDELPTSKDNLPCNTIFYETDSENPWINYGTATTVTSTDLDSTAIEIKAQGTSSLEYPRKNFQIKFAKKIGFKGYDKDSADKKIVLKADYMDSSGAHNIGNAQVVQNSIIPADWPNTPVKDGKRIALDGFPCAVFHSRSVDSDLNPVDPEYIGTFNFNYSKKANDLFGWEDPGYDFQGFEFRSNTSTTCLQTGVPNLIAFMNSSEGYEWRWSALTDVVDDYHDVSEGALLNTIDGGYFGKKSAVKYNEQQYINSRFDTNLAEIDPYVSFYINQDGEQKRLYYKGEDGYSSVNYFCFNNKEITDVFSLEYGVKIAEKDGQLSLCYQLPYGVSYNKSTKTIASVGSLYDAIDSDGNYKEQRGYYKFERRPDHTMQFDYNEDEEYFKSIDNWTAFKSTDEIYYYDDVYTANNDAEDPYILDVADGKYHALSLYNKYSQIYDGSYVVSTNGTLIRTGANSYIEFAGLQKYERTRTWHTLTEAYNKDNSLKIKTQSIMMDIFCHWYYCVDMLSHLQEPGKTNDWSNYRTIIDSNYTDPGDKHGNSNGKGLFIYTALLDYYVVSLITGLCDNFAKNMMIHSYDGGMTWVPAWYDMDTCYGLNNSGSYVFDYDVDFMDAGVFNGSNSTLWKGLYNSDFGSLKAKYYEIRKSKISYEKIMNVLYGQNIQYKSEGLYNNNALFRYIIPDINNMSGTKLEAAQGNRLSLLRYWNKNRQTYLDSRYLGSDYIEDRIQFRMYAPKDVLFEIVPDTNMHLALAFDPPDAATPDFSSNKIKAGETWSYNYSVSGDALRDKNTYIYGASHLMDLGDMSYTVAKIVDLSVANKLRSIRLGMYDQDLIDRYEEVISTQRQILTLPQGVCKNCETIDLHNCKYLSSPALSLVTRSGTTTTNNFPSLTTLKVGGSNISSIDIGDYTPLEEIELSDVMTVINFTNLPQLKTVTLGNNLDGIKSVTLSNCPELDQLSILRNFVNKTITISADNLQGSEEESGRVTTAFMDWLVEQNASVAGEVWVENIADSNLEKYRLKWPDLTVNLYQIYEDEVIFGVSGEGA